MGIPSSLPIASEHRRTYQSRCVCLRPDPAAWNSVQMAERHCHGRSLRDICSYQCLWRLRWPPVTAQTFLNSTHMLAVLIAAKTCANHSLRQIVADVQAELAPNFFINAIRMTDMDIGTVHKRFNRQHTLAVKGSLRFTKTIPIVFSGLKRTPLPS